MIAAIARCRQFGLGAVAAADRHFAGAAVPALFGLLSYVLARQHSWRPAASLSLATSYLLCASAAILWAMLSRGERISMAGGIARPLALLATSMGVSLLVSDHVDYASRQLILYLSVSMLGCATYLLYRDSQQPPVAAFCAVIAVVHLPFLLEVMLWVRDAEQPLFLDSARVPNFQNVRHLSQMSFIAAVSGTAFAVLTRQWRLLSFLLASSALFGILALGARGALLSWAAFVALLLAFSPARMRVAVHAVAALLLSGAAVWCLHVSGVMETPNMFARFLEVRTGAGRFDSGRVDIWVAVLREIIQHPLFGQGPEAYEVSGCCRREVRQPHNFILQFMMEFGIVGCALAGMVLWRTLKALCGPRTLAGCALSSHTTLIPGAAIAAYAAYGLIDGLFYFPLPLLHLALFCGLFAAAMRQAATKPEPDGTEERPEEV